MEPNRVVLCLGPSGETVRHNGTFVAWSMAEACAGALYFAETLGSVAVGFGPKRLAWPTTSGLVEASEILGFGDGGDGWVTGAEEHSMATPPRGRRPDPPRPQPRTGVGRGRSSGPAVDAEARFTALER